MSPQTLLRYRGTSPLFGVENNKRRMEIMLELHGEAQQECLSFMVPLGLTNDADTWLVMMRRYFFVLRQRQNDLLK
jgi:hypothetical protein